MAEAWEDRGAYQITAYVSTRHRLGLDLFQYRTSHRRAVQIIAQPSQGHKAREGGREEEGERERGQERAKK
eukprot:3082541-Rhodomonas_salina.1